MKRKSTPEEGYAWECMTAPASEKSSSTPLGGLASFADHEVLELLLYYAIPAGTPTRRHTAFSPALAPWSRCSAPAGLRRRRRSSTRWIKPTISSWSFSGMSAGRSCGRPRSTPRESSSPAVRFPPAAWSWPTSTPAACCCDLTQTAGSEFRMFQGFPHPWGKRLLLAAGIGGER